jgi:hypothetical protein
MPKRAALAQALFREINERAEEQVRVFRGDEVQVGIVCECADIHCLERILISKSTYEAVRAEPTQFIVKPGHVVADVEEIVSQGDNFEIIRKRGLAADVVRYLNALPAPTPESD